MFFPLAKFGKKPVALLATQVLCVSNERTLSSANQNHRAPHRIRADLGCTGVPSKKSVSVSLYQKCHEFWASIAGPWEWDGAMTKEQ